MGRSYVLSGACMMLILCGGCYTTKAAMNPYSYAPSSPSRVWQPPKSVKAATLSDTPPELPKQEDPFSLAELIDIALAHNTMTRITWATARSAAAQYGQSQQKLFPQLDANFSYERVRSPSFGTNLTGGFSGAGSSLFNSGTLNSQTVQPIYYSDWGPQLRLSYLVFDFGAVRATTESYRQALYNADWNHNSAIQQILKIIMDDYYRYTYQKELLISNAEDVETTRLVLEAASTAFETGVRDVSDVLQAKTQFLNSQTVLSSQQQQVTVATSRLLTDMGLPATTALKTQELPDHIPETNVLPPVEDLIAVALQNRPDLLATEASLKSSQEKVKAAKRDFLPKLNYSFDIGRTYFNGGLNDGYDFDSFFSLSMPLFSGFYHSNSIKLAKAERKKAEEALKERELEVIQNVADAHSQVRISFDTLQIAKDYLAVAKEQFTVSLSKYKQGTNTILDVTTAQSTLANAKAKYIESVSLWYSSLAELSFATGMISPTSLPQEEP